MGAMDKLDSGVLYMDKIFDSVQLKALNRPTI